MEFSTDAAGLAAFENFLKAFDSHGPTFRQQLALMHYMQGLAAGIIVVGMFLLGNYRIGHLFAAIGCAAFASVSKTVVDTIRSYPQISGNEAMLEHAPQGIIVFAGLAAANFVPFLFSNKPFFPSPGDCDKGQDKKQE